MLTFLTYQESIFLKGFFLFVEVFIKHVSFSPFPHLYYKFSLIFKSNISRQCHQGLRGPMDKALVYGTRDSGFDPQRSRVQNFPFCFYKPLKASKMLLFSSSLRLLVLMTMLLYDARTWYNPVCLQVQLYGFLRPNHWRADYLYKCSHNYVYGIRSFRIWMWPPRNIHERAFMHGMWKPDIWSNKL